MEICLHKVYSSFIQYHQTLEPPKWSLIGKWTNYSSSRLWSPTGPWKGTHWNWHMTWISLKYILLSERSQIQKAPYYMIPLLWHSGSGITIRPEKKSVVPRVSAGERDWPCRGGTGHFAHISCLWWWIHTSMHLLRLQKANVTICKLRKNTECWGNSKWNTLRNKHIVYKWTMHLPWRKN